MDAGTDCFDTIPMRLQILQPYTVFFRNLIYCQHTSMRMQPVTMILFAFPLGYLIRTCTEWINGLRTDLNLVLGGKAQTSKGLLRKIQVKSLFLPLWP